MPLLLLLACKQQAESVGSEKEIIVLADSLHYLALQEELSLAFEREVVTPWPEKIFELRRESIQNLGSVAGKPRLVLIGTLQAEDPTSKQMRSILNAQQREKVSSGESYLFKTDDPWSTKQRLLILAGVNVDTLKQRIAAQREGLFELFHEPLVERVRAQMYSLYEQKDVEKRVMQDYGWSLRVQHDYKVWKEFPEERFLMLRRVSPERWLFITWKKAGGPEEITQNAVVTWRNEIGARFYDKDRVAPADLSSREVEFAGRRALQVSGLWENTVKDAGGPFKTWAFYDENTEHAYLIDVAVFAPGMDKIPFLRQLEIMARTFHFRNDRTEDQTALK